MNLKGGGFSVRPVSPATNHRNGNYLGNYLLGNYLLGNYPASKRVLYKPVDLAAHELFSAALKNIPAEG
ncbi:MAG: hypothetical protein V7731_08155 [Amphritea sp.]